jgi:hypothetical protein
MTVILLNLINITSIVNKEKVNFGGER